MATWQAETHDPFMPLAGSRVPLPPVSCPPVRQGVERGGNRREVSVSLEPWMDIPCLGQIPESASFQEPEPAALTPYPMPENGTAGRSAHHSKKCG